MLFSYRETISAARGLPPLSAHLHRLRSLFIASLILHVVLPFAYRGHWLGDWSPYLELWRSLPGMQAFATQSRFPDTTVAALSSAFVVALVFSAVAISATSEMRQRLRAAGIRLYRPSVMILLLTFAVVAPWLLAGVLPMSDKQLSAPLTELVSSSPLALGIFSAGLFAGMTTATLALILSFRSSEAE